MRQELVEILTVLAVNSLANSGNLRTCCAREIDEEVHAQYERVWNEFNYLFQTPSEVWAELNAAGGNVDAIACATYPERLNHNMDGEGTSISPLRTKPHFKLLPR